MIFTQNYSRPSVRLLLSAALLCSTCGCGHKTVNSPPTAIPYLVTTGTVTESENARIDTLRRVAQTTPVTVSDVDWLLSVAYRKSPNPYLHGAKLDWVAKVLLNARSTRLPASRRGQVLAFAANEISFWQSYQPVVVGNNLVTLENVPMGACLILRGLGTPEALEQIRPLLQSPNKYVREFAQKAIASPSS